MTPTILITGPNGQLGFELRRAVAVLGQAVSMSNIDLRNLDAVRQYVDDLRPDVILNAAAYTAVDRAETDRATAARLNADLPGVLAKELQHYGGKLIVHYSTDYVFNGKSTHPYREEDRPDPVNAYGETKLGGELAVQRSGARHLILRTQWVYATRRSNFVLTVLRLAREGKPLRIIADQVGAPTWARMLAAATLQMVARALHTSDVEVDAWSGVYHVCAAGQTTWHGFAEAILSESLKRLEELKKPAEWCANGLRSLTAIATSEYPTPARRPAFSVMSNAKVERAFGLHLPDWREQLRLALEDFSFPD